MSMFEFKNCKNVSLKGNKSSNKDLVRFEFEGNILEQRGDKYLLNGNDVTQFIIKK